MKMKNYSHIEFSFNKENVSGLENFPISLLKMLYAIHISVLYCVELLL